MLTRRGVIAGLAAVPLIGAAADSAFAALERRSGGRLGVAIVDTGSGRRLTWRADERFPMCSTFKLLAVAGVLARVDRGTERLNHAIAIDATAVVGHAPRTRPAIGRTLPVAALCDAAITVSDNGAANLLLGRIGGPAGLTAWLRAIGDPVTRLDRIEPGLNECRPGDPRDTTSPAAMVATLERLTIGDVLRPASRQRLVGWLIANTTGGTRLRAGLPSDWRIGDKTGTSDDAAGTSNDVALVNPLERTPLLVAAFLTRSPLSGPERDAVIADVGRLAAQI